MAPLPPRLGHRLLRRPICRLNLAVAAGALACRNRHSFDFARAGPRWSILVQTTSSNPGRRYRLLGQHKGKPSQYAEATNRAIGTPSITRVIRHTVRSADAVRDAVLMGPSARHPAVSPVVAETEPVTVTLDIALLYAPKRGAPPGQNRASGRKGRHRFPAPQWCAGRRSCRCVCQLSSSDYSIARFGRASTRPWVAPYAVSRYS
ncbi:MAG: hypothetical protein WB678_00525 [Stellaceae bacterium]